MSFDATRLSRLRRALELFAAWQAHPDRPPADELLRQNPDVADLLEALMADAGDLPSTAEIETGAVPPADAGTEDELGPGTELGGFVIESELGRGAMGVVYAARQRGLGRGVALKVLPAHARLAPQAVARFRRESALLAGLDHEGLADVITVGRDRGHEFFAMELVDGAPLSRILQELRGGRPTHLDGSSVAAALRRSIATASTAPRAESTTGADPFRNDYLQTAAALIAQVADALHHAHEAGVLHRDVKPSNILVTPTGRAVLTDFGLARREASPSMTRTGEFAGTPFYVAPEQVVGSPGALDRRADVFSLGVTLYELITLERPFRGASNHDVVQAILGSDPADPRRIDARIPADLAAITLRALEKRPADRYPTAKDFAEDLQAFVERRPVSARPLAWHARLRRNARRQPAVAALVAVLAISIPSLAALGGYVVARLPATRAGEAQLITEQVEAAIQHGTMLLEMHEYTRAERSFAHAAGLAPDDPRPPVFRALLLRRRGRQTEARELLAAAATAGILPTRVAAIAGLEVDGPAGVTSPVDPVADDALSHLVDGVVQMEQAHAAGDAADFERARESLERAALLSPDTSILALTQLAHALGHLDDPQAARRVADVLEVRGGDSGPTLYWAGFALRPTDLDAALALLERAATIQTQSAHHIFYNGGSWLLTAGRDRDAVRWLTRATDADPEHAEAWANLGNARSRLGDWEGARDAVTRALALQPERAMFHANLGGAELQLGEAEAAEASLEHALELDPAETVAISNYAMLLARQNRVEELEAFTASQREAGRSTPWLAVVTARLQARRGDREAAFATLEAGIEAHPDHPFVWTERGRWLVPSDLDAALRDLEKAATLEPPSADTFAVLAHARKLDGQLEAALDAARRAIDIGGPSRARRHALAILLDRTDRHAEALEVFSALADDFPDDVDLALGAGKQLFDLGRYDEAWVIWEELLPDHPDHPGLHQNRSVTLLQLDDTAGYVTELQRWCDRAPNDPARHARLADVLLRDTDAAWFDPEQAREAARRAMPEEATGGDWLRLARAERAAGDVAASQDAARRGIAIASDERTRAALEALRDG